MQIIGVEDEEREGSRDRRKVKYVDVTHQTVVKRHGCGKAGAMPTSGSQKTVSTRYLEMVGMQWLPLGCTGQRSVAEVGARGSGSRGRWCGRDVCTGQARYMR